MEEKREAEVWQRVMTQKQMQPRRELGVLLREVSELTAVYRRLAGKLTGRGKLLARKLLEAEQSNGDCLRGIGLLSGHSQEQITIWEPVPDNGRRALEKCYHRTQRCREEYAARSLDPEYGEVFRSLADREGQQCARITELLGWMKQAV